MTDQQKKAVEEAAKNYLADGINYQANTISKADIGDLQQLASDSLFHGAQEVLNDPEKYGLVPASVHENLTKKYKDLVRFYDKHVGAPCEEIRHQEEVERLKEENARLRSGLEYAIKALKAVSSWGATTPIINTLEKALKGGTECKP